MSSSGLGVVFSDDFNVVLPSVLGSNRNGSTSLTNTFPTTSTGDSLGHYHYTESGTNALQFLNASGSGVGGHKFYNSNTTDAPVLYLTIDKDEILTDTQFKVDKSSSPTPPVYSPNVLNVAPDNKNINFPVGTNFLQPPYNFNQTFNPVYMTQTTAIYTEGELVYAVVGSPSQVQIFKNNATTNPIPPNVIPSGFPNSDATGVQVGIPLFSLTPVLPSTTQTAILSDTLEITTDTDVSELSATDLTFNSVSLPTSVATNTTNIGTNTTNIATNTSNIATNTTNIAKNTSSISKLQYASPITMANSPVIYGTLPSSPPMVPTTNAINSGFNGWYYKNISSAYNNISWAMGFQPSSYVVSNLKGFYFTFVSLTTTSKPFMSVYTLPATPPNFYLSRRSYVPAIAPATITAGIPYIYYYMFDNNYPTPFKYCHTAVPLTLSGVNPVGPFDGNELLYFMSINTNSISAVGTEELIIQEGGVIIDDGTGTLIQPFSFNGSDVYSPNSYRAVLQGAGTITPTISNNGTTYIATANFTISNAGLSGVPVGFFIIVQGTTADRTITYNTSSTKIVHTNTGTTNASQVIFYWTGTQFTPYN